MIDVLEYFIGPIRFLTSRSFRFKKRKEWVEANRGLVIFEVGMWLLLPTTFALAFIVWFFKSIL